MIQLLCGKYYWAHVTNEKIKAQTERLFTAIRRGERQAGFGPGSSPTSQALSNPVTSTHVCPAGSKPVVIGIVTFVHSIFFSVHSKEHKIGI